MDDPTRQAIERWLEKADHDLEAARLLLQSNPQLADNACFHSQQSAEKCLKACLTQAGIHVEKTHDLDRLLSLCVPLTPEFETLRPFTTALSDYAVAVRYIDDYRDISPEEAGEAIGSAEAIKEFVARFLTDAKD